LQELAYTIQQLEGQEAPSAALTAVQGLAGPAGGGWGVFSDATLTLSQRHCKWISGMHTAQLCCYHAAKRTAVCYRLAYTIQQREAQEAPGAALAAVQGLLGQLVAAGVFFSDATLTLSQRHCT
jgi:hypothetical protein